MTIMAYLNGQEQVTYQHPCIGMAQILAACQACRTASHIQTCICSRQPKHSKAAMPFNLASKQHSKYVFTLVLCHPARAMWRTQHCSSCLLWLQLHCSMQLRSVRRPSRQPCLHNRVSCQAQRAPLHQVRGKQALSQDVISRLPSAVTVAAST